MPCASNQRRIVTARQAGSVHGPRHGASIPIAVAEEIVQGTEREHPGAHGVICGCEQVEPQGFCWGPSS